MLGSPTTRALPVATPEKGKEGAGGRVVHTVLCSRPRRPRGAAPSRRLLCQGHGPRRTLWRTHRNRVVRHSKGFVAKRMYRPAKTLSEHGRCEGAQSVVCLTLGTFGGHSGPGWRTGSTPGRTFPPTPIFTDRDAGRCRELVGSLTIRFPSSANLLSQPMSAATIKCYIVSSF